MEDTRTAKNVPLIYGEDEDEWARRYREILELVGSLMPFPLRVRPVADAQLEERDLAGADVVIASDRALYSLGGPAPSAAWVRLGIGSRIPLLLVLWFGSDDIRGLVAQADSARSDVVELSGPFDAIVDALTSLLLLEPIRERAAGVLTVSPESITAEVAAGLSAHYLVSMGRVGDDVVRHLAEHSDELYRVPPRFFEELIAELLHATGWKVELSPIGADGGIDIVALRQDAVVPHKMLVQAKRYGEHRKVDVRLVREFLHVVDDTRATSGMIVTTSGFTAPAWEHQRRYEWRLSLKDHAAILAWMRDYLRQRAGLGSS
jgi:HJR/Mrr/RecB family endonuclease